MTITKGKYFWVIGGGQLQAPLLEEVSQLGMRSIVTDANPKCICAQLSNEFFALDIFDIDGHIELADRLIAKGLNIVGVLAAGIDAPETMARIARHLNLPSVNPEIAQLVHNKVMFRERLEELGHPVPRFATINAKTLEQLPSIAKNIGFPLIIKNTDSSGSRGTKIFYEYDLPDMEKVARAAIAISKSGIALVESCWEGSEHTVETLFDIRGDFHPCFITDREFDKTHGFAIETGLRHPSALPADIQKEMFQIAEKVARDIGVEVGAAKYDFMVTADGPRIIEMTVRLSGGYDCQYLVPATTGKSVMRAAILTAVGKEFNPELLVDHLGLVGVTGSLWPKQGLIKSIKGVESARKLPGILEIFFRSKVGDIVEQYVDCTRRTCFIIATGSSEVLARENLERASQAISIETEEVNK